jgi:hypothetical protein
MTSSLLWLHSTRPENLADIQRIQIGCGPCVTRPYVSARSEGDSIVVEVDMTKRDEPNTWVVVRRLNDRLPVNIWQLRSSIMRTLDAVIKTEDGWKPKTDDFFVLRKAVEKMLK